MTSARGRGTAPNYPALTPATRERPRVLEHGSGNVVRVSPTRSIYEDNASLYVVVGGLVLVLVFGFTALALLRARRRSPGDPVPAQGKADKNALEASYVVLLCLVTAGLVTASFIFFDRLRTATAATTVSANAAHPLRVDVDAAKWRWRFVYPRAGVSSIAQLVVPADRPVRFVARSADVLHDFWVPAARFQKQVWPDRSTTWTLKFTRGTYDGVCAWFCGLQHDRMRFTVRAVPEAQFRSWLQAHGGRAAA
jgi:cytochrome c oxidase subunit 2